MVVLFKQNIQFSIILKNVFFKVESGWNRFCLDKCVFEANDINSKLWQMNLIERILPTHAESV